MSKENKEMFSAIAENYDNMNRIISLGADSGWRRRTAEEIVMDGEGSLDVLDIATGTGDIAIAVANEARLRGRTVRILGMDFNDDMLRIGRRKVREGRLNNVRLVNGDGLATGLKSGSFDVITSGFALRNFDSLEKFMKESYRVLKPGGRIVHLDVARPDSSIAEEIMWPYYFIAIPAIGAFYNKSAYNWLVSSAWKFDRHKVAKTAEKAGFEDTRIINLTLGAAYILTAKKPGR
jgi:demethylmenaquinone methyltransferase / 2-methoxy-6-polyprenyl-1,4-benzoquinol methylase